MNVVKNPLRQPIEVDPHRTIGVKSTRIGQVVRNLYKQVIEFVGVFVFILQDVFKLAPFFLILLNKLGLAHNWALRGAFYEKNGKDVTLRENLSTREWLG